MPTRTVGILLALFMISWAVHAGEITLIGAVIAARTRTGADGSFTFQNVAAESYTVAVTRDGFAPAETTVQVADGAAADVRVVLQPAGK